MKSEEVVVKVESPQNEDEADRTNGLSGGTLEASILAELGEDGHSKAKDEGKKNNNNKRKKEFYECRFCEKTFGSGQSLGGHMNGHHEARDEEKMIHYEKLFRRKNLSFRTVNPREYVPETSSYPISNFNQRGDGYMVTPMLPMQQRTFIQQPPQQMEPPQAWPADSQQFSWPQASTNDINSRKPTDDFTKMPNLPTAYFASDGTVNGNYGPPAMDPSMSELTSQYSVPAPNSMSSNVLYDNFAPCDCCNPLGSGTYQDPQMNMHGLHTQQGKISTPTLERNQPRLSIRPNVQMNSSPSVQHAQSSLISGMGNQEMAVPQVTRLRRNPSNASDAGSSPMFNQWSGKPTNHTF